MVLHGYAYVYELSFWGGAGIVAAEGGGPAFMCGAINGPYNIAYAQNSQSHNEPFTVRPTRPPLPDPTRIVKLQHFSCSYHAASFDVCYGAAAVGPHAYAMGACHASGSGKVKALCRRQQLSELRLLGLQAWQATRVPEEDTLATKGLGLAPHVLAKVE